MPRNMVEMSAPSNSPTSPLVKPTLVAFHLPQFHPTAENDKWWGAGFTEWTNVAKSQPLYPGHGQPHLPADLGYYDLRLPEARAAQAALAAQYGIEAFCYYHYWFHGKRLLNRPVDGILQSGEPDFPFCLCWANEPWSRTWLGDEKEVLIGQRYSRADDRDHARWLAQAFADPRYLRTDMRPIFLIYRASHMDAPDAVIDTIREGVAAEGVENPYIVLCDAHEPGRDMQQKYGSDMTIRFEPQLGVLPYQGAQRPLRRLMTTARYSSLWSTSLKLYDYRRSRAMMRAVESEGPAIRTVLVRWDNSPRRGARGIIMTGATPDAFYAELTQELARADWNSSGTGLMFVNAWNEWAEGNHLEPDQAFGHGYLEAVRAALVDHSARRSASIVFDGGQRERS